MTRENIHEELLSKLSESNLKYIDETDIILERLSKARHKKYELCLAVQIKLKDNLFVTHLVILEDQKIIYRTQFQKYISPLNVRGYINDYNEMFEQSLIELNKYIINYHNQKEVLHRW